MQVIKIGAVWCKDCLVMSPIWEEIKEEMPNLKTEYFEADENPELLDKYNVQDIPSFIFLSKNGEIILKLKGMQDKKKLINLIKENIDK